MNINNSEKCHLLLVGIGKIAHDQHIPAIEKSGFFEVTGTISHAHPIAGIANFHNITEAMASGIKFDAVAICTPPQVRAQIVLDALANNLHVLMEKPPTSTLCEFEDIIDAHSKTSLTLFTAWHSRYAAKVDAALEWLKGRKINKGKITWRESAHKWHPGQQWLWDAGGMGIFDPAINAFSIVTKLLGKKIKVTKAHLEFPSNQHAPIAAAMNAVIGGVDFTIDLDFREENREIWEIELLSDAGEVLKLSKGGAEIQIGDSAPQTSPDIEYISLYREFAELIKSRRSNADNTPCKIVADAFVNAEIIIGEAFNP